MSVCVRVCVCVCVCCFEYEAEMENFPYIYKDFVIMSSLHRALSALDVSLPQKRKCTSELAL